MLENDAEARNRARKLRHKALVGSIALSCATDRRDALAAAHHAGSFDRRFHRHARAAVSRRRRCRRKTRALERASTAERYSPAVHLPDVCAAGNTGRVRAVSNDASSASIDNAPGIGDGGRDGLPGNTAELPEGSGDGSRRWSSVSRARHDPRRCT